MTINDLLILSALVGGELHALGISRKIVEAGGSDIKGGIYNSCQRLENQGLITGEWGDEDKGPRKKRYKLTPEGKEKFDKERNVLLSLCAMSPNI